MTQTLDILLPYLQFLAGAGAGWVASVAFDWLRARYPLPTGYGWLDTALHAPRLARWSVWFLSAAIALPAAAAVAVARGEQVLPAVDAVLASLLSMVVSQIRHGQQALAAAPASEAPSEREPNAPPATTPEGQPL